MGIVSFAVDLFSPATTLMQVYPVLKNQENKPKENSLAISSQKLISLPLI